jgi:hypothetical protein
MEFDMAYSEEFKKKFIQVLKACAGNITAACDACNICRDTIYSWQKENPSFKKEMDDIREVIIDNVESALYKNALEGNVVAQIFFLKTQGKQRGYIEKSLVEHGGLVQINEVRGKQAPKEDEGK